MEIKINKKPIPVPYENMLIYKIFQTLFLIKEVSGINLKKYQILLYILKKKIKKEDFEKIEKVEILKCVDLKMIDYLLQKQMIEFKRGYFYLTDMGKEMLEYILKIQVFEGLQLEIKELKKNSKIINQILKK
ncbi:hypothetical protein [Cetobacterium sp.]|uniref:hypothetical protein n=1 Tax=Cetobacterium sp. TaxID=2071632 RepID=UPI003F35CB56